MRNQINLIVFIILFLFTTSSFASNVSILDYTINSGSTLAYVTNIASTAVGTSNLYVCDTSGKLMIIASGSAGNEVPLFTVQPSACSTYKFGRPLLSGSRLSVKSSSTLSSGVATTGVNAMSLFP